MRNDNSSERALISQDNKDKNGNLIMVDEAEGCEIRVHGRDNIILVRNQQPKSGLKIVVHGDKNKIDIGRCKLNSFSIEIGSYRKTNGVQLTIGDYFSIEPGGRFQIFTDFADINIGKWCMFSRDITVRYGENPHLIFELDSGIYRDGGGGIRIGDKVWVGEGAFLLKNAGITDESIVAARSVVTKKFSTPHILIGGSPASILRENIQWFRNREQLPANSKFSRSIESYDADVQKRISERKSAFNWPTWPEDTTLFLCVGAMKSGTSWLYNYLKSNPDVHFAPDKEIHYWDVIQSDLDKHHFRAKAQQLIESANQVLNCDVSEVSSKLAQVERSLSKLQIYSNSDANHLEYKNYLLKSFKGQKAVGDITPSYCTLNEQTFTEICSLTKSVKFIFIMRDPVERLWSAIRMRASEISLHQDDLNANCKSILNELKERPDHFMLTRSDYKGAVTVLDNTISAENIKYIFFEDMFRNQSMKNLCDFLGIRFNKLNKITQKVREGDQAHLYDTDRIFLHGLLKEQYTFLKSRFGKCIPKTWQKV